MSITATKKMVQKKSGLVQQTFQILGEPSRFAIFDYLIHESEICVRETAELLHITSAAACQHLKTLEGRNILHSYRVGKEVCYQLNLENPLVRSLKRTLFV